MGIIQRIKNWRLKRKISKQWKTKMNEMPHVLYGAKGIGKTSYATTRSELRLGETK